MSSNFLWSVGWGGGDRVMMDGVNLLNGQIMDVEELLRRYAVGERDFMGVNLRGANLSGSNPTEDIFIYDVDLSDINLSGSADRQCYLSGS